MPITRLGGWGGPRMPFGSFAGKTEATGPAAPDAIGLRFAARGVPVHFAAGASTMHYAANGTPLEWDDDDA